MHNTVNHLSAQSKAKSVSAEALEAIRSVSPIVDVAAEHVKLRRSGSQFTGKCPLHEERTPSFYVSPAKGVFHCHGCGQGGDVFEFIQLLLKCTFREAVNHLAARGGVQLQGFKPSPELMRRVAAEKARREKEQAFEKFCNERLNAIGARYRALGRAATHAEDYLRSGLPADAYLNDLAWCAIERFRRFESRVEREGLCDVAVIRHEWSKLRAAA